MSYLKKNIISFIFCLSFLFSFSSFSNDTHISQIEDEIRILSQRYDLEIQVSSNLGEEVFALNSAKSCFERQMYGQQILHVYYISCQVEVLYALRLGVDKDSLIELYEEVHQSRLP